MELKFRSHSFTLWELFYCVVELNYFEKKIQIELDFTALKIEEKFSTENYSDWVLHNSNRHSKFHLLWMEL